MALFEFSTATFEQIQRLLFPLVETIFGLDVDGYVGKSSELFLEVAEGFDEIAGLFHVAAAALEDGILTAEELDSIILEAKDIPEALSAISEAFGGLMGTEEDPIEE